MLRNNLCAKKGDFLISEAISSEQKRNLNKPNSMKEEDSFALQTCKEEESDIMETSTFSKLLR